MKKSFFLLPLVAATLLASCSDEPENTRTATLYTLNLVTPGNTTEMSTLTRGSYLINMNITNETLSVGARDLVVEGNTSSFTTPEVSYAVAGTQLDFTSPQDNGIVGNYEVRNLRGIITPYYAWGSGIDSPTLPIINRPGDRLIMSYYLGNRYRVETVQDESYYTGTTTTSYNMQGADKSFVYTEALYRVILDVNNKKATVAMYNCRFAEEMPVTVSFILKDLDIVMEHGTYVVRGTDVEPIMTDGTPMPTYKFNTFEARAVRSAKYSEPNLIGMEMQYTVAGRYSGAFKGEYAILNAEGF